MIIKSLKLKNFRNYKEQSIILDKGVNLFYGDNAQGKTNILEAIYICATTKSHRGGKDKEMILFGNEESHIKLQFNKTDMEHRLDIHFKKNKPKGIAIDQIPLQKASELLGWLYVVFFSPEDLSIIKEGPSQRRRFMDMELCQLDKLYTSSLMSYHRVLLQRNKLLKEMAFRPELLDTLEVWDAQLIRYGSEVIQRREQFILELKNIIEDIHFQISGGREKIEIVYEKDIAIEEFSLALQKSRNIDMKNKMTTIGPHRDDIGFFVQHIGQKKVMDLKRYGSQGQHRTAALSLKLSELVLVKERTKEYPILLLDDVLSELDFGRQTHLLNAIQHIQTIITCTGLEDFQNLNLSLNRIFCVKKGQVILKS